MNLYESVTKIFFICKGHAWENGLRGSIFAVLMPMAVLCPFYAHFIRFSFSDANDESATGTKICTQPAQSNRAATVVEMVPYA